MKIITTDRFGQLARTYWQPLVLSLLALLAFSQVISWGVAAVELHKVDSLIDRTQSSQSSPPAGENGQKNSSKPEGLPKTESSGQESPTADAMKPEMAETRNSGQSSNEEQAPVPVKNIFKKDEQNYIVSAIYLDKAVINGEAMSVGQSVGKAKVKEIGVFNVVLEEENGQTQTIEMFQNTGGEGGEGESAPPMMNQQPNLSSMRKNNSLNAGMGMSVRPANGMNAVKKTLGSQSINAYKGVTPDQFKNMSSEERKRMRDRMSPTDREQLKLMRQMSRRN